MAVHSNIGVFAALGAIALSLQGCALFGGGPPDMCVKFEFDNGVIPRASSGEADIKGECDDGYEYDGPSYECQWVNRECLLEEGSETKVTADCHDDFGFGVKGAGLKEWPEDVSPMRVKEFSRTWSSYFKKEIEHAEMVAREKAAKLKEQAAAGVETVKEAAAEATAGEEKKVEAEASTVEAAAAPAEKKVEEAAAPAEKKVEEAAAPAEKKVEAAAASAETKATTRRLATALPKVLKKEDMAGKCKKVVETRLYQMISSVVASGSSIAAFAIGAVALAAVVIGVRASRSQGASGETDDSSADIE